MATNPNRSRSGNVNPAQQALPFTKSDSETIAYCRAVYVGTGGNMKVKMFGGSQEEVTFTNVNNGQILPIEVTKIFSTGTTAADFIILY